MSSLYPPPLALDSDKEKERRFKSLNIDLQLAAKASGSPVIGMGGGKAMPGVHISV